MTIFSETNNYKQKIIIKLAVADKLYQILYYNINVNISLIPLILNNIIKIYSRVNCRFNCVRICRH